MLPNLLNALTPGCVLVTPGDRADLVVGAMARAQCGHPADRGRHPDPRTSGPARRSSSWPTGSRRHPGDRGDRGLLPHGGRTVRHGRQVERGDARKAETALGALRAVRRHGGASCGRSRPRRPTASPPMMFEHKLLEQARSDKRRVVLPEGTEGARAARRRRAAAPRGLRPDAARAGGADPQEGRGPRRRPRRLGAHRPAELGNCGTASPPSTRSCAPTRASPWSSRTTWSPT